MKKICLIHPDVSNMSGGVRVLAILANALSKEYQVFVVSIVQPNPQNIYFNELVKYRVLLNYSLKMRYQLADGVYKLRCFFLDNKIDIAISIGTMVSVFLIGASCTTNVKTIVCEHCNLKNLFNQLTADIFCRWVGAKYSDKLITLTQADKTAYIEKYKLNENKIDYIYNFIDDKLLECKSRYKHESKIILSVGRFDRVKGYEMLIRVAKNVFAKHSDWQWHIYGDGDKDYIEEIRSMIHLFGLEKHVLLMGESSEIYEIYKEAAIFVLTSYFEGLPMVLLEAKANNLPTIAFDCPTGPKELIEDAMSGFLIEAYDEEKMVGKICMLIEDVALRQEFSLHAKDNLDKFDRKTIIEKWVKLIESL